MAGQHVKDVKVRIVETGCRSDPTGGDGQLDSQLAQCVTQCVGQIYVDVGGACLGCRVIRAPTSLISVSHSHASDANMDLIIYEIHIMERKARPMPSDSYREPASADAAVTLINVVEIPADQVDQFVIGWKQRAEIMSTLPGFRDYALHRALIANARYQLVNVAHWDSSEAFEAAMANPEFSSGRTGVQDEFDVTGAPALYRVVASGRRDAPNE